MSKISFAWPNLASLQGESPFFIYITGARRFSWHLRQRQQPPFFIPEELQNKAVPEVLLIWQREGGREEEEQMLTLLLWDFHLYSQPCTENEAPVSKRAEQRCYHSSRSRGTRLKKSPLVYPRPMWSEKWRMKPSFLWKDTDTSPQSEPLLSLQEWCRLSNMMQIMWWKKGHKTNLSGMLGLTPRALCEHHWHISSGDMLVTAFNPGVLPWSNLLLLLSSLSLPTPL